MLAAGFPADAWQTAILLLSKVRVTVGGTTEDEKKAITIMSSSVENNQMRN